MSPRATWNGHLTIALVLIPIKVYPATESSESLKFNQLHATCHTRTTQKKWCPICAREVPNTEIVKGFEFEPGQFVLLEPEELDAVQPPSTKVIDLVQFSPEAALPRRAIDRAYYLAPDGVDGGPEARAYALLRTMLAHRHAIGIGKLAIYGREYLVAVVADPRCLMLYTLHHAAELRSIEIGSLPDVSTRRTRAERDLLNRLIEVYDRPLNLADFRDEWRDGQQQIIDAKIEGKEFVEPVPMATPPVLEFQEALRQSLLAVVTPKKIPAKARPLPSPRKRA